jgi:hypothetical protein
VMLNVQSCPNMLGPSGIFVLQTDGLIRKSSLPDPVSPMKGTRVDLVALNRSKNVSRPSIVPNNRKAAPEDRIF